MSLAIRLDLQDYASPVVRAVVRGIAPERVNPVVGRSAVNTIRAHLFAANRTRPNALGGTRTNFYASAARGTSFESVGDGAVVSIAQVGIRQRVLGGTIKPKTGKFLTIPVAPQAHGKRAREFGDLEVIFGPGGQPVALATKGTRTLSITQNKAGKIVKRLEGRRGVILFRLVRSVTQRPDPSVLPSETTLQDNIGRDVSAHLNRLVDRASRR